MTRSAGLFVLIFAIMSGFIASAAVIKYVRQQENQQTVLANTTQPVVIAKDTIPVGTAIQPNQVEVVQRAPETLPANAIRMQSEAAGRVTLSTIYPGEVIVKERLADASGPGGLPLLIPKNMRAITLKVDDTISVAGFVRPGHHVDVVSTIDVDRSMGRTVSKTILQNVKVIATGQEIENNVEQQKSKLVPTVTVLVTLEQAERLSLAINAGSIRLVLRNHDDNAEILTEGVTLNSLIPQAEKELKLPAPEPVMADAGMPVEEPVNRIRTIEVYRGADKSEVTFAN
ncbi:MAG TPA: Flp pilus assembly protein CpaB [bacterium]|nr:Flp pilus assembly protein CpaB [bacterium]